MKTGEGILLGLGTLIGIGLLRKSAAAQRLNFYPDTQEAKLSFEGITPVITVGLVVQNPNNQQFIVNSISGNVYANNYLVSNVSNFSPVTIGANKQTTMPLKLRLALIGITNDIIRAIQTGNIQQVLELRSYVNVDGIVSPLNINYTIG